MMQSLTSTGTERARSIALFLIRVLVVASVVELVVKLLWRTGTYLPLKGVLATIYFTLHPLQGVLFNFASLLTFVALGLVAYVASRDRLWEGWLNPVLLVSVSVLLILSAAGIVFNPSSQLALSYVSASSVAIAAMACYAVLKSERLATKLAVAVIALAFLSYRYYVAAHVVNSLVGSVAEPFLAIEILALGELLFALAPLALFIAYTDVRKPKDILAHRLPLAVATAAAAALAVANTISPAMTSVYSIWMLGFSLQHPIVVYVLGAWFLFFTLTACMQRQELRYIAFALLLMFVSGYTHKFTYHHLLGLLALIVLIEGRQLGFSRAVSRSGKSSEATPAQRG